VYYSWHSLFIENVFCLYYIKLKQACKVVDIDHKTLHDLRDTFIIRMWAITGE